MCNMKIKKILIVLLLSIFIIPIVAKAGTITTLDATASGNKIKISGTTNDVLAIAALVYSDNNLVYMGSCSVNDNHNYSCTLNTTFKNGKYTVKVADYAGGDYISKDVIVNVGSYGGSSTSSLDDNENNTTNNKETTPNNEQIDATLAENPKTKGDSFLKYIIPLIISLGTIIIVSKKIKA